MEKEGDSIPADDQRCKRSDGRGWRCKRVALAGKTLCDSHFNRNNSSQKKKNPRIKDTSTSSSRGNPNSTPIRIRFRVKPEPLDDTTVVKDNSVAMLALPVFSGGGSDRARVDSMGVVMRGPRTKRANVVGDVEVELREGDGGGGGGALGEGGMRGPRTKRPNVIGNEGVMENGGGNNNVALELVGMRGPRTKRPNVVAEVAVEVRENGGDGGGGSVEVRENGGDGGGGSVAVTRCRRDSGKGWRCEREAKPGFRMCDHHLSIRKYEKSQSKPKKTSKMVESVDIGEIVIKEEVVSEKEEEVGEEVGNQLDMVADLAIAEAEGREGRAVEEEEETEEEDRKCSRTDGRKWRCKRRVSEGKTLCDLHFEQGKLRSKKITVPESMKITQREGGGETLKRKRMSENDSGKKRTKADSIRGFLRREIIKPKSKGEKSGLKKCNTGSGGVTKDLPYGLMAIPPIPISENNGSSLEVNRVGGESPNLQVTRRFRSKNAEPPPVGTLAAVPFAGNGGRKKCHWCRNYDPSLTTCLSCKKRFFCAGCLKERKIDPEEVKVKCPACLGHCNCRLCRKVRARNVTSKNVEDTSKGLSKSQQLQYLLKFLLPILERINQEQNVETEIEGRFKGQDPCDVEIRQAEADCRDQCCCNNCKSPILDFHRSCPNCSYNLCLICCREYNQGGFLKGSEKSCPQPNNIKGTNLPDSSYESSDPHISCPAVQLGGCDKSLLDLRCIFPLNWTKELEIIAKETESGHELPQTSDNSLPCSICISSTQAAGNNTGIEASRRISSQDNVIYCPKSSDDHEYMGFHFQKHWRKGQPVKVQNALETSSVSNWDPFAIFCSCLESNPNNSVNGEDVTEAGTLMEWYEAEIGTRESFSQSLEEGYTNRRHNTLRVKAKLSSDISQRLLADHYNAIINGLPLQEYTNSVSGLLNIAGKLPEGFPESKLGPHLCIAFGSRDVVARGELVTKLHYNCYDVVYILAHVADTTYSIEQLNEISMLVSHNNKKDKENNGFLKGTALSDIVVDGVPSTNEKSSAELPNSDTVSDALVIHPEPNSGFGEKTPIDPFGAQWDVFRREDVPKLKEYIMKHVEELSFSCDVSKNVVHPIFDGSFYLDSIHKMQLKDEFDIEPWTFNQCLGEAVVIPAGCPYQIRNVKTNINIALGFVSPENASECIKLINEIRTLPNDHKAKEVRLEVEKMVICSIDEAINKIYRLRTEESALSDKGIQIHIPNS